MTTDPTEREFKLRATATLDVAAVDALLAGYAVEASRATHVDTYFDDERHSLLHAGIGLRTRTKAERALVCCKSDGVRDGALHVRREVELPWVVGAVPATAADLPAAIRAEVEPRVLLRSLQPVVTLTVLRERRLLRDGERVLGELAIDTVAVQGARGTAGFCELELEVGSDLAACEQLAARLAAALPVEVATDNKLQRAFALVGLGDEVAPDAAAAPTTIGELLAQRLHEHFGGIARADAGLRDEGAAEHVHQLRVHLRRLRSLLTALRDALPAASALAAIEFVAAWNRALGTLRDADVALHELPQLLAELPAELQTGAEALLRAQQQARQAELERVRALHADPEHLRQRQQLADLAAAKAADGDAASSSAAVDRAAADTAVVDEAAATVAASDETDADRADAGALEEPGESIATAAVGDVVAARLRRAARRVQRRLRECGDDAPLAQLHDVRLAIKRLRYLAEECSDVVPLPRRRVLRRVLRAQVRLGAVCDHDAAAKRYLTALAAAAGSGDAAVAATLGACAAVHHTSAAAARAPALRALQRLDRRSTWAAFDLDAK